MTDGTSNDSERCIVKGWQGRYYEDFTIGDIYKPSR